VLAAALVALPVSAFLVQHWLDSFAYRVDLDARTFFGAVLVTWLVACALLLKSYLCDRFQVKPQDARARKIHS
jgi:hypothetical protein